MFRKLLFFLVLLFSISLACISKETDSTVFCSFEELISYETDQIERLERSNNVALADAYLNRAESYLIGSEYELALNDIERAYTLLPFCQQAVDLLLRPLLDFAFCYALLGELDEFHRIELVLKTLLDGCTCSLAQKNQSLPAGQFQSQYATTSNKHHTPLLGPDKISVDACVARAGKIANASRILIAKANKDAQVLLKAIIKDLEARSQRCCMAGGRWKTCLQPVIHQWETWEQKWRTLGLPPDPSVQ